MLPSSWLTSISKLVIWAVQEGTSKGYRYRVVNCCSYFAKVYHKLRREIEKKEKLTIRVRPNPSQKGVSTNREREKERERARNLASVGFLSVGNP